MRFLKKRCFDQRIILFIYTATLNCPHNEMKLKQNERSVSLWLKYRCKTVSILFQKCFETVLFQVQVQMVTGD